MWSFWWGRGEGWHLKVVNNIKAPDNDQVPGEDSTKPNTPFSKSSSAYTAKFCVKWPDNLASRDRNWKPILAKGSHQYRSAGREPAVWEHCSAGVLAWTARPTNSWGVWTDTTSQNPGGRLSTEGRDTASGLLGAGCWDLPLSCLFLAGPHNSLLGVRAGDWQKMCWCRRIHFRNFPLSFGKWNCLATIDNAGPKI